MTDVFVSYKRENLSKVTPLVNALRAQGMNVWWDQDIPPNAPWEETIEHELSLAKFVIVAWSPAAVASDNVRAEARRARQEGRLLQVFVEACEPPLFFGERQGVSLVEWSGDTTARDWRKVMASIGALGREAPSWQNAKFAAPAGEPLLAVLAFDNLSGDPEMAYFSDGVSEEVLQTVARGAELKVLGRGSSFQFRGPDKAAAHVAATLGATHVLDGSVRRSGNKVRIAANLIECARETTLWSDRFDRELSDVFALQDEIAAAVAAALKVAFAPAVKAETVDPAAYSLYLKALDIRNRGLEPETRLTVIELLAEATTLSPRFARAWAFLATTRAERLRVAAGLPYATTRAEVETAAEAALGLDPGLGAAYQALSRLVAGACFADREALHEKALSVAPNDPTVLTHASLFFTELGRVHEALGYARRAYNLDPMYPWVANWYANMIVYAGRPEDARAAFDKFCALWPDNVLVAWNAMLSAGCQGDWARVDQLVEGAGENELHTPTLLRVISVCGALRDPSPEVRAHTLKEGRDVLLSLGGMRLSDCVWMYRMGLRDEVFEMVDQANFAYAFDPQLRSPDGAGSNGILFSIGYNTEMMRDPRFPQLCAKIGLCDYWVKTECWPDCAEAVAPYYDFKAECRRRWEALARQ